MTDTIELSWLQLSFALIYVIVVFLLVRLLGVRRERTVLDATFRMTVQLVIAGYVLTYVFDHPHAITVGIILVVMLGFAILNTYKRVTSQLSPALKRIIAISLITGTVSSLAYFLLVIVSGGAWEDPRYFIPIAGMLVGGSMTGVPSVPPV